MSRPPNLWTIPPGVAFLPALAEAVSTDALIDGAGTDDPSLADMTIYVPTRRAARALRGQFVERMGGKAVILPTIRPLGEFDEEAGLLDGTNREAIDLPPPAGQFERLMALAPLVRAWKSRLPAHVAALFEEQLIVPASTADAIWLSRDLAALIDEFEAEDISWDALDALVPDELAGWWQVTLDFLKIVTEHWPQILDEMGRSNPAAWRSAQIDAEAERISHGSITEPLIAAGSTGSIPATARLFVGHCAPSGRCCCSAGPGQGHGRRVMVSDRRGGDCPFGLRSSAIRAEEAFADHGCRPGAGAGFRCDRDTAASPFMAGQ